MFLVLWSLATTFLFMKAVQPYILLTANLEDVHAIAKQLANSPVAEQLKRIWRRASNQFNMQVAKAKDSDYKKRAGDQDFNSIEEQNLSRNEDEEQFDEDRVERRQAEEPLIGKNASFYLTSGNKGLEDEKPAY